MPNQDFYCNFATGSNLSAGSTEGAPLVTYTSAVVAGGWTSGTGVFTVASGDPIADGVEVGMWGSVYVTAGATVATFIARVTARTTTTVTVSTTVKGGTAPATDATGGTTLVIGGVWKGPNAASWFPFGATAQNTLTPTASTFPRCLFKNNADYVVTTGPAAQNQAGPFVWEGYRERYTGVTAVAASDIITKTAHGMVTGDPFEFESFTGFDGLLAEQEYHCIRIDDNTFYAAESKREALLGNRIDITVDGSAGVLRAKAHAMFRGTTSDTPFQMIVFSATRHELNYLEFKENGWDIGAVSTVGDWAVQFTSGGTSYKIYRCKGTYTYRDFVRSGGAGGELIECEGNGCNANAGNGFAQFNASANTTYTRCWAHHSQKTLPSIDAGAPGFGFQGGTAIRIVYNDCLATHNGGQGFWNVTGTPVVTFNRCISAYNYLSGFELTGVANGRVTFDHCIIYGNNTSSGAGDGGIRFATAGYGADGFGNAFGSNTNGNFRNGVPARFRGNKLLTAAPFTDGPNGDFTLNNTAGGGAALRGWDIGWFFGTGTSTEPSAGARAYTEADLVRSWRDTGPTQTEAGAVVPAEHSYVS